ncbi:MAG: type II toxin-antitoxin system HipA family toxin YjjJ [Tepidimonas sp.]
MLARTVEDLLRLIRRRQLLPAQEAVSALGISRPTLMRLVRSAGDAVLPIGQGRRRAYAARRPLRGSHAPLPLYRVDASGLAHAVGHLHLAHPSGTWLELSAAGDGLHWPLAADSPMRDGWFDGIPYFLQDMRPQGFLGRQFAQTHAAFMQVSPNPEHWSDDDTLHVLSILGTDTSGDFILGDEALRQWQHHAAQERPIAAPDIGHTYLQLAQQVLTSGSGGSSAAGEFPKFGALRAQDGQTARVLVKFSGTDDSAQTRRWADLLVCESLAADVVNTLPGVRGSRSRILQLGGRTLLEVERFDRHGLHGRSGLCSWAALNGDWFGLAGRPWHEGAARLAACGLIDADTVQAIERLVLFGRLIANNDMHDGNLSFQPDAGRLRLAPVYDMLPMAYRPQPGVELPEVPFATPTPLPRQRTQWHEAARAALDFWARAAADLRISAGFREICARNAEHLRHAQRLT